jgi:hypothetical protein
MVSSVVAKDESLSDTGTLKLMISFQFSHILASAQARTWLLWVCLCPTWRFPQAGPVPQ